MQKKLLVISEINLNNENRGIEILNRTFASLSRQYSITAISVGKQPLFMHENWLKLNDTIFNKVHHIKYIGYLANYFFWAYCYLKTKIFVASNKPKFDIMYLIGPMSAFIGKNINYDNIPVINRYLGVAWDYEGYQSIPQRIRFFLKKQGYKSSQGTIIMTNDGTRGAEFLKKMGIFNKIYFMRNGITKEIAVDLGYVKHLREIYGIKHDQTVLLTVSRLASWKRVDRAICLLKELLKANDKYILMIVGDGEERDHLISLANELNCLGNIRFIGAVENKLTPNYFYLADIFLS
ncbi:partial Alpha-monoglucosyldiacylglycerol synthase, partial [Patescibacteria group bacterium]